jgi:hypothetical protein
MPLQKCSCVAGAVLNEANLQYPLEKYCHKRVALLMRYQASP